jgi:tryptophanyl-tRNA synthetase
MDSESNVNPWEVKGEVDYKKLVKKFGTNFIDAELSSRLKDAPPMIRRDFYYSHRDLDKWLNDFDDGKKVSIMTGRGPSEKMHIGHLVPFLAAKYFQDKFDCEVFIALSDDEKFFVKPKLDFEKSQEYAKDNILDIIALGFNPKKTFIYQDFVYTDIYKYAARVSKRITYSEARSIFGLTPSHNLGWSFYPAMQVAHILFPQFTRGKHRTLVPVAIDQEPFIRLTRDVSANKDFKFKKPAAIHAKFIPSLDGGSKMSSSGNHVIFLTDEPSVVKKKINRYAFSGGQTTVEEHRERGGNTDVDISFQYLKILFEEDDKKLKEIEENYTSGKMLSGELKAYLIEKVNVFLENHMKNKEKAQKDLDKFIVKNDSKL